MSSSGENCICDAELEYKCDSSLAFLINVYVSFEVNGRVCIRFTLENWFNIFLNICVLLHMLHWVLDKHQRFWYVYFATEASLSSWVFFYFAGLKKYFVA